jgi:Flp pilus assembly secretin CpaC
MSQRARVLFAGLLFVASLAQCLAARAADSPAHISDITIQSQSGGLQIVIHADGAIDAQPVAQESGTVAVRLNNAVLPPTFPAYQSVVDPVVQAVMVQQTSLAPASALLSFTVRGRVAVNVTTSDGGRTVRVLLGGNLLPSGGALTVTPPPLGASATPPGVVGGAMRGVPAPRPAASGRRGRSGAIVAEVYALHFVTASDAATTLRRAFPGTSIVEAPETNSVIVRGPDAVQAQVAAALAAVDIAPQAGGALLTEVVQLRHAVPASGGAGSTSATDVAGTLTAVLGQQMPDLKIVVPPNQTVVVISGSPATLRAAKDLLAKIDTPATQLVLDTGVYEVDENAAKNIGLEIPGAVISTTFTEISPQSSVFGTPLPKVGPQPLTRTPISFTAQLNFLLNNGSARVLANPRVTTISGRAATIRAGDNIPFVQTNTSAIGGTVSQTVLTFQTGVTLDITPIANPDGLVSVTLHPIVNTLTGITQQGVPQISSREAQTTVDLRDNETVVIGGLIQENSVTTISRIPGLSSIPLIGGLFKNNSTTSSRSELIIVVTPHVIQPGHSPAELGKPPVLPTSRLLSPPSPSPSSLPMSR